MHAKKDSWQQKFCNTEGVIHHFLLTFPVGGIFGECFLLNLFILVSYPAWLLILFN